MNTSDHNETDRHQLVAFAIDDNTQAWYEMVIPFIVSLRATDYRGRIGVIGYGLSDEKQQRLRANGIEVYAAAGVGDLAWDRYISAAAIFDADPALQTLALYDADIWFPGPRFDIFDVVPHDEALHVAPDAHFCAFVMTPLIGERRDALIHQCVQDVLERLGQPLQAGLVVGGREPWARFARFVREQAGRIGQDFVAIYGLDTTFLHLWGGLGHVRLVGCEQNFVTKWGLHERHDFDAVRIVLEHQGKPIRGLHMTGDVRFLNHWRYLARHAEHAIALGQAFALAPEAGKRAQPADPGLLQPERFVASGLSVLAAHEDVLANVPRLAAGPSFRNPQGHALNAWAAHTVEFAVTRDRLVLDIWLSHLSGQPAAPGLQLEHNGVTVALLAPHKFSVATQQGDRVVLRALTLPGQACHTAWDIVVRHA
ncbi:TPA: hypothetical protein QDC27_002913 [Burkholderia cepacia ATCC 25416]|uniref:hypothetical protein n=1 Tax=Burkholderia cepacia TaxID=292 RepID=UPI001CF26592|nr:hypothetical protein [Burkholderia cepacia]HDR9766457.1 hypothetical protein [Burkholderia cepacia ATCC 25416]MCA8078882.1 hypothetical protein [Burkholderia cepacia]HDR9775121.1 hypothetical protein [Burkholderia cepacia ATCC 25416]HDR9782821.1 hypothetical protein [Burkholderia cepacia ATCC 25416]HDR9790313.1 hypothetical protein [Burkholderia cepacia ATCC 25416]